MGWGASQNLGGQQYETATRGWGGDQAISEAQPWHEEDRFGRHETFRRGPALLDDVPCGPGSEGPR